MIILCFFAFGDLNQMASFPLHFDFFPRGMYGPIFVIVYVASPARDETLSPTLNGNEVSMIACCVGPNVADKSRAISESILIRLLSVFVLMANSLFCAAGCRKHSLGLPRIFLKDIDFNQFLGSFLPFEYNGYQMYTNIIPFGSP